LVEVAIAQQSPAQARARFMEAEAIMPFIRHGFIRNKFQRLDEQIKHLQTDFIISGTTDDVDYKRYEAELQSWLLQTALREDNNLTRVAERLNISKKTVYMWLEKHRIKVQ
jgi:transcriptional regulator with PAS, ATPase and Fis domain